MSSDIYSLESIKCCSNTLTSIKLTCFNFTKVSSLLDGFKYLTQLRSLQFSYCTGLTTQVFQALLDIPALKIESLKVEGKVEGEISGTDLLVQKVGPYLKHLELRIPNHAEREKVFKSVLNYCDQIQLLRLSEIGHGEVSQLFEIIIHLGKHLRYLSLKNKYYYINFFTNEEDKNLKTSSMILKGLGQILSDSLEYLDLNLMIEPNDLKTFLKSLENVELNKLLVRNSHYKDLDTTFNVLKEVVRENKVKNLAYQVYSGFDPNNSEHLNLDKLVTEAQSFIKIERYDNIVKIRFCNSGSYVNF